MLKKLVLIVAGVAIGAPAMAAVSAAEAAKLGAELTPLGAVKAGNADGSIPAWEGGLTSAAQAGFANFRPGQHHPDPYASDKVLYTVTAGNMGQYAAKLTEGQYHPGILASGPEIAREVLESPETQSSPPSEGSAAARTTPATVPTTLASRPADPPPAAPRPSVSPLVWAASALVLLAAAGSLVLFAARRRERAFEES